MLTGSQPALSLVASASGALFLSTCCA